MERQSGESPQPDDLAAWRRLIAGNELSHCTHESVVAAIQSLGPNGERRILNALMKHISDVLNRILRNRIGRNHPNEGFDIIERAHTQLIEALLQPNSPDGKGLAVAFKARVDFRAADAIRAERLQSARQPYGEDVAAYERTSDDMHQISEEHVSVENLLKRITDPRKRLAWRLHMERVPLGGTKGHSIARIAGVSAKTAGEWIEEIKELLKGILGDEQ